MTCTDTQIKKLMQLTNQHTQETASAKVGIDPKTARKYIQSGKMPSAGKQPHDWLTHADAFSEVWPELAQMLKANPKLEAKTLLEWLQERDGDETKFQAGQLRTLQRRVRDWRARFGPDQEIFFPQQLYPGRQSQSDCTSMNELQVCLAGQPFPHLLFHFMLPYSRWETVSICFSESFASLSGGYEKAVWELGAVAPEHRTDNLTAATQRLGSRRAFTKKWSEFLAHYGVLPSKNNPGASHENGSVEKSHDLFKGTVEQQLCLRGHRDFADRAAYEAFLAAIAARGNKKREAALAEELALLAALPERSFRDPLEVQAGVSPFSTIVVLKGIYSVPSRLIGHKLRVLVYHDVLQVMYGRQLVQEMGRLPTGGGVAINYRHIIDQLLRKPGAFADYRYREELFPRVVFRRAYDRLRQADVVRGEREYLRVLQVAARGSENDVALALEMLLEANEVPTAQAVKELAAPRAQCVPHLQVPAPDLGIYDALVNWTPRAIPA